MRDQSLAGLELEDLAEMKSRKLVRSINERNSTYTAAFNPSAVGMDEQKRVSEEGKKTSFVSREVYEAMKEIINLVRLDGVSD